MLFDSLPASSHPRFTFRPILREDLSPWAHYLNLPEVFEHTSWDHPRRDELASYLGNETDRSPSSLLRLAIARRVDGHFVGTIGFHTVRPDDRCAELAYDLAPAFWGQGIVTSLGAELVAWAHADPGLRRVQATVLWSNTRSIATLERLGFVRERLLPGHRMVRGSPGDFHLYAHVTMPPIAGDAAESRP